MMESRTSRRHCERSCQSTSMRQLSRQLSETAVTLTVRAFESAHRCRCGRLSVARRQRCVMSWMRTYRIAAARLNCWAMDRLDSAPSRHAQESKTGKDSSVCSKVRGGMPMFVWQAAPSKHTVQSDSDWAAHLITDCFLTKFTEELVVDNTHRQRFLNNSLSVLGDENQSLVVW